MKVLVDAYYSNNFGDDLLIYELVNAFPEHSFYLLTEEGYSSILSHPDNVYYCGRILPDRKETVKRGINKLRSFFNLPKREIVRYYSKHEFDMYLQYGGSIFMQTTKRAWINKVRDYRYVLSRFKASAVIGCNFGPYTSEAFYETHKQLFRQFDLVTFRDSSSYSKFETLDNVALAADVGLLAERFVPVEKAEESDYYIVSPIDLSFRHSYSHLNRAYCEGIANLICELYCQTGKRAVVLAFCEDEGDGKASLEIVNEVRAINPEVEVEMRVHSGVVDTLRLISNSCWVVGCRFHAVMVGLSYGKLTLPISYSAKIDNELVDLGFTGRVYHIEDVPRWNARDVANEFLSSRQECGSFKETASSHFKLLGNVLVQQQD